MAKTHPDGLLLFEKDNKIMQKFDNDNFLLGFFRFIVNPFKFPPNSKAKKRFSKYEGLRLNILRRKTVYTKQVFYVPQAHNIHYFRAEKAMLLVLLRSNYRVLKKMNPRHIEVFYQALATDVLADETTQVDMAHVFTLVQFFLLQNPADSIRNIVHYHLVYELFAHCEYRVAAELLIGLITPGDNLFRLEDRDRKLLSDYLEIAGFGSFFVSQIDNFKLIEIYEERARVAADEKVKNYIENIDKLPPSESSEKNKSFLLNYFHSLFNKDLLTKFHRQPEEIYTKILNIDRLPNTRQKKDSMGGGRKLARSSTVGNLENLYDIIEGEELNTEDMDSRLLGEYNNPGRTKLGTQKTLVLDYPQDSDRFLIHRKRFSVVNPPSKSSKLVRAFRRVVMVVRWANLILRRPQMKTKLKNERKAEFRAYPEKIPTNHPEFRNTSKTAIQYLDSMKVQEKYNLSLSEIVYGIVSSALTQKTHQGFNQMIRLVPGNLALMNRYLFDNHEILLALLRCYIKKIGFWYENKQCFMSAYWAAKSFVLIAKNM